MYYDIINYTDSKGLSPLNTWLKTFDKNQPIKLRILKRIDRLRSGNFGDRKSLGAGLFELRLNFGSGYRIYYAVEDESLVILLVGGDKSSQKRDIEKARLYLKDYKENPCQEIT